MLLVNFKLLKKKFLFFLLISPLIFNAQTFRNYSNEFLNIGVDAAALGMGKSVVATTNNVNAIYWNPAGLVGIEDYQGSLMHASYFASIAQYEYGGLGFKINDESAGAFTFLRFGVDNIPNTAELIDANGNINYDKSLLFLLPTMHLSFPTAER